MTDKDMEGAMSEPTDTPITRLRALHRKCSVFCIFTHWSVNDRAHCEHCADPWPCDTIAALDALEKERDGEHKT